LEERLPLAVFGSWARRSWKPFHGRVDRSATNHEASDHGETTMRRTVLEVPKMDCAAEERLVRMALDGAGNVARVDIDLALRHVIVVHDDEPEQLLTWLLPLDLGVRLIESREAGHGEASGPSDQDAAVREGGTLRLLLAINAVMFAVELVIGWLAESTGLIADSLDMFADAAVYGVSLYAVGKAATMQTRAARLSGYLQLMLALGVLFEVVRRFVVGSEPEPAFMIGIALLALAANVACMALIARHRRGGVHMRASWIFSTNDVIANVGVILAGLLVAWTGSHLPDLVVGSIIALVVFSGALRILRLSRTEKP